MVFFYFKTATDGFPWLWVRPLPGADKGSSQRRRNRESADRLTGGRADDHVRKEISFPLEKTEKAICTIPLVAQSARSEDGKHRRLFLMRWAFADSNPCTPEKRGRRRRLCAAKCLTPAPRRKRGRRRRLCKAKCLTLSAIQLKRHHTHKCVVFFCFCHFLYPSLPIVSISFFLFSRNFPLPLPVYYLIRPYDNCIFLPFSL